VDSRLDQEDGVTFDVLGTAKKRREEKLGLVSVETFGGAAASYPDGPKYVHYINRADKVPSVFGLIRKGATEVGITHAGRGAKVIEFEDGGDPALGALFGPHMIDVYMKYRVPFEEARGKR
jgi:hypothetical protein